MNKSKGGYANMGHTMKPCSCIIHSALALVCVCVSVHCTRERESKRERLLLIGGNMGVADWCVSVTDWYIICSFTQNIQRFWAHNRLFCTERLVEHKAELCTVEWSHSTNLTILQPSCDAVLSVYLRCLVIWLCGLLLAWSHFCLGVLSITARTRTWA